MWRTIRQVWSHRAGAVGTAIWLISTAKRPDTALHSRHHRAGAGGNYDFADDTENGRIRLCIDAGPRRTLIEKMNGRSGRGVSRAAVPKNSRLVASGADPYEALSCFFRVIGEIAVPLAAAR